MLRRYQVMELSELQQEAMEELFNIAYGMATSLISDSIGKHATMYVPKMYIVSIDSFSDVVADYIDNESEYFVCSQVFLNYIEGETVLFLSKDSSVSLTECYASIDDSLNSEDIDDVKGCTLEVTNIMTSALIGKIAELTNSEIYFQPPEIELYTYEQMTSIKRKDKFSEVIVIEIILDIDETEIKGNLYVLLKGDSLNKFKAALDFFIDNYSG
jgi:chemotaxis protein CheC